MDDLAPVPLRREQQDDPERPAKIAVTLWIERAADDPTRVWIDVEAGAYDAVLGWVYDLDEAPLDDINGRPTVELLRSALTADLAAAVARVLQVRHRR